MNRLSVLTAATAVFVAVCATSVAAAPPFYLWTPEKAELATVKANRQVTDQPTRITRARCSSYPNLRAPRSRVFRCVFYYRFTAGPDVGGTGSTIVPWLVRSSKKGPWRFCARPQYEEGMDATAVVARLTAACP